MAIVKIGTYTATGSAFNLNLGFYPSHFRLVNQTKLAAQSGVAISEKWSFQPNAYANIATFAAGIPTYSVITTNGFTPYGPVTGTEFVSLTGLPPAAKNTNLTITGISKAANASITATHAFTTADVGVTTVTFHGVVGMTQINTLSGVIQSINSTTDFTVNINTTNFTTYSSGGIANVITGTPATTQYSFQVTNTPLYNTSYLGLTVGSSVCGSASDVLYYQAILDVDFTSA